MAHCIIRTDGGARGNPGPAGIGFVMESDGDTVCAGGAFIGTATNNVAEYRALLWGLRNALQLNYTTVDVFADSELLVKQLNGHYKVKNQGLKPLYLEALRLVRRFDRVAFTHVRRDDNVAADAMANAAMDAEGVVGSAVCAETSEPGQQSLFGEV